MSKLERGFEGEGIEKVELRAAREPSTPWEWLRWAFDAEISNSAEKFVLVALAQHADRSGKCYPSVARLSAMTAQSRRSVQNKLAALAARGLITREERLGTSTLYTLNSRSPEDEPADVPNAKCSADGKISRSGEVARCSVEEHVPAHEVHPPCASPAPLPAHGLRTPRARRAPKHPRTPKSTPIDRDAAVAAGDLDLLELQSEFLRAFPKGGSKVSVKNGLVNALKEGATKELLLSAARSYAAEKKDTEARFIKSPERWLREGYWEGYNVPAHDQSQNALSAAQIDAQRAQAIKEKRSWIASTLSPTAARNLVARGLVTPEECRAAGVL